MGHEFIRPTPPLVLVSDRGERYVPVAAVLDWVRREKGFTGTELELIRRMEAIGLQWMRHTAVNPDDPSESITVDMFRLPAGGRP